MEKEIKSQIWKCALRDLKWFLTATAGTIALLAAINMPLLHFAPHTSFGPIDNLFIIQVVLTGVVYFTPVLTKLQSIFGSLFVFFQCFIFMVADNQLRIAFINPSNPFHPVAKFERLFVIAAVVFFFFALLVQVISRKVLRTHFFGKFGFREHNLMPNKSFAEFIYMQKSSDTMAKERQLIARIRPLRD